MQALQQIGFFGGLLTALLGLVLILIVNDTGHKPEILVDVMLAIVFISGSAVIASILKRGM